MHTFIGSRTVTAKPMTKGQSTKYISGARDRSNTANEPGYMVEDPKGASNHPEHKGTLNWIPALNFTSEFLDLGYIQDHTHHNQRILGEVAQLEQKLTALKEYMKTPLFLKLSFTARDLMQEQSRIMTRYVAILEERMQN